MEHVVFFSAADGSPAYRRTANLDDAVRVVEHLRNVEGVEDVHVYSLDPVALSFRPYYRVEVGVAGAPQQPVAAAPAPAVQQPAPAPVEMPAAVELLAPAPVEQLAPPVPVDSPAFFAPPAAFAEPVVLPVQPSAGPFGDGPAAVAPQDAAPAEPAAVMAVVAHNGDDAGSNGRGARGLGFFTR
ncbi:MAG TPA: hypothetical protein VEZ46_01895 [Mycobacteriales bacterium]|nr:hypothetical protein [Mycobacteriales bacterium]